MRFLEISGVNYACRQARFLSADGSSSVAYVSLLRSTLPWRPVRQKLSMPGSVSHHGVCATDLSGKPARYRSPPSRSEDQAISHGHTGGYFSKHIGRCQRATRLANLCRLRPVVDQDRSTAICRGGSGPGTRQHDLRTRRFNHRFVPVYFSIGIVPFHQVSRQAAYSARSVGQYPHLHSSLGRQTPRRRRAGHIDTRTGRILYHGSRLPQFHPILQTGSGRGVLCHSSQKEDSVQAPIFKYGYTQRQSQWREMRPDHCVNGAEIKKRLPSAATAYKIPRLQHQPNFQLSDQQLHHSRTDSSRSIPLSLAGVTLL